MQLIELHILQSFPVSCLNRDDVGAPKTAVFGGAQRARISSQCLKRAIRELAQAEYPKANLSGIRTKLIAGEIQERLVAQHKTPSPRALEMACAVAGVLNKKEGKPLPTDDPELETLFFASPKQLDALADLAFKEFGVKGAIKADKKMFVKACLEVGVHDAADIALFGRMVAADPSLTLEGAAMFSHALSTHKAENDLDFYSAVDELKPKGAGMIGTIEFTSAVYYRYAAINLDLLCDSDHLAKLTTAERRYVVDAFISATLLATPGARKNSMNAHTLPAFVLGIYKQAGQPLQLVNAFEQPVWAKNGLVEKSVEALKAHHEQLKKTWDIKCDLEVVLPDTPLKDFVKRLTDHVQ